MSGKKSKDELTWEMLGTLESDKQGLFIRLQCPTIMKRTLGYLFEESLVVSFFKYRFIRSGAQNRYIHGVVVRYVQYWLKETTGVKHSHDAVYTWLRVELLQHTVTVEDVAGTQIITMGGKRFSKMNTAEFAEAIDYIRAEMLQRGIDSGVECDIPEPSKDNFIPDFIKNI